MADSVVPAMAKTTPPFRLLGLPPELRCKIYHCALHSSEAITVTSTGYDRPALISAFRQVRHEALAIFYMANMFILDLQDYNSAASYRFILSLPPKLERLLAIKMTSLHRSEPHWRNVLQWLERYHADKAHTPVVPQRLWEKYQAPQDVMIVSGMFQMVKQMAGFSWKRVKQVVEVQREVLANCDVRWLED